MEEITTREVLYEARTHASRSYSSNYPPQQVNQGENGGILSLLSIRGVGQIKEKWNEYRRPKKMKKWISLFVSPRGEYVAVASGNQITILQKDDDYREPCGIFTCGSLGTFTHGAWSESHDIFGVADDTDTVYFIKASGDEITRFTKKHLKVSVPIIGLIVQDDSAINRSCLCSFNVLTSDGILHQIEISKEPSASTSFRHTSDYGTSSSQFPRNVFCLDYHLELSLLVVVGDAESTTLKSTGNSGSCGISLWRRSRNLDLEAVFSTRCEGLYSKPKDYSGHLTCPKVLISPNGTFVVSLDLTGCLNIFKMEKDRSTLSCFACREFLTDIVDFTWWSDDILTVAKRSGSVTMFDVLNGINLLENIPEYSMPVLERAQQLQGEIFLLDNTLSENESDITKCRWKLISFSERSVPEMYNSLITNKKYQAALDFADRHGLNRDEVFKAQWVNSLQGINEIDMFLLNVKDLGFVLSECVDKVGSTEDVVKSLLAYGLRLTSRYGFSESEDSESDQIWGFRMTRLQLLQFRDRLETFLGISMGRFSVQDYCKFRVTPLNEVAISLAESGKIGALNLLFKRHLYSLSPSILEILSSIPETVPVQTYAQLLPGRTPPINIALREKDWVESEKMASFIKSLPENHETRFKIRTEHIAKLCFGIVWPAIDDLSTWYMSRARDMDSFSGQLDNSLGLVDFACRKGISELQGFHEDILYLHQLIYSDGIDEEANFTMSLVSWERLSDYEKFKMMLRVKEEIIVERLREKAVAFMRSRLTSVSEESFLVSWLKESAEENKLDTCLMVIEEGCKDFPSNGIFRDQVEAVDTALQCIYLCTVTDRWNTMGSILSKLPRLQYSELRVEGLDKRLQLAEGHIEAGRLLAFYQIPKPMSFFLEAHSDGKGVKQILRLILSKFVRRQPGRSDNEWANMWRDMQCLQEKAFPFIDPDYMLMEFCRGLLKAGKFSLARNYLKGTAWVALPSDKAESIVIQAARDYFFSASSLACSEIWKAKECLNLFPNSRNVKAESDIIDALTIKLPNLGITILPMQFRQIKDPMEIIKTVITSQAGAYIHVDELIEIAKLLGLNSQEDISALQEAIAREAAVAGDLQLAFDLCLLLAKKGHGIVWDLCAAIARGPALENMDIGSRKQLLGFALSHCDEESIGELLHAWKDLDTQGQTETLVMLTETNPSNFSVEEVGRDDEEICFNNIKNMVLSVAKDLPVQDGTHWESLLREHGKTSSFAAFQLPWLLELSKKAKYDKLVPESGPTKQYGSVRIRAVVGILSWLARNGFAPKDDVIALLAKCILEPPVSDEDDVMGCSLLLNLVDAFNGVEVIEEQLTVRENYQEIRSIMNVGMTYSSLHNYGVECEGPAQRKELLLRKFQEKHSPLTSGELEKIDKLPSTFWRDWKLKLEEKMRVTDHSRALVQIIPGVETTRFLSGDSNYIQSSILSLIESLKLEKKCILTEVLRLADTYGLDHSEVLLRYFSSILVSDVWTNDDITTEIAEVKGEILARASETIKMISVIVYPAIDGRNKPRLAYIYSLLSECYTHLEETKQSSPTIHSDRAHISSLGLARYYEIIAQECGSISFIENLNFKNIAELGGLNFECFRTEVFGNISEFSLEALANTVRTLVCMYDDDLAPEGLVLWQDVYKHYVLRLLTILDTRAKTDIGNPENLHSLIGELEHTYESSRACFRVMDGPDALDIMKRYFTMIIPIGSFCKCIPSDSTWLECLITIMNFWIRVTDDMQEIISLENPNEMPEFNPESVKSCLKVFMRLVMEERASPSQGWATIFGYVNYGLIGGLALEIFIFCRAMVFSGCGFGAISEVFAEVNSEGDEGISHLYLNMLEPILQDFVSEPDSPKNLYRLLSSLSEMEGDLEELKRVRHVVWERMGNFCDNLKLPSHVRVYALELMQFITGRNIKAVSSEIKSNVFPWDGWVELPGATTSSATSNSTLVALRSSQLVATISPDTEVTSDDLLTVESATSHFLNLCGASVNASHFDALISVLGEWEGLFVIGKDEVAPEELSDVGNNWGNNDWDDGWESFHNEETETETETEKLEKERNESLTVHPLHVCWMEIIKKLVSISRFNTILSLIDQSLAKHNGVLLDEDGSQSLCEMVLRIDCFMSLKISLLLPYENIYSQCLVSFEDKLKQGGIYITDTNTKDQELLILILSSGLISTIVTNPSYGTTFSYLCGLVGNFSRVCQEEMLKRREGPSGENGFLGLFRRLVFPCFVSELVKAGQQVLAGLVVTKFMHTNMSLSLLNVADASLSRYLRKQLQVLEEDSFDIDDMGLREPLGNTVSDLRGRLGNVIRSALSALSTK